MKPAKIWFGICLNGFSFFGHKGSEEFTLKKLSQKPEGPKPNLGPEKNALNNRIMAKPMIG